MLVFVFDIVFAVGAIYVAFQNFWSGRRYYCGPYYGVDAERYSIPEEKARILTQIGRDLDTNDVTERMYKNYLRDHPSLLREHPELKSR